MPFFPILIPITWLVGILSIAALVAGGYVVWLWFTGVVIGTVYVVMAATLVLWSLSGRWIALALLGSSGDDGPRDVTDGVVQRVRRSDGAELQVECFGPPDAPPVVLAPGWGIDAAEFYYLTRSLANRFRLITWDPRGLAESRGPSDDCYALERMVDDLDAVLSLAERRPALLVGHSLGGMLILMHQRLCVTGNDGRILGLVLANTTDCNPLAATTAGRLMQAIRGPVLTPLLYSSIWLSPLVRIMNWLSYLNGSAHLTAAWAGFAGTQTRGQLDYAARLGARLSPAVVARGYLAAFRYDESRTPETIRAPVLVITADRDRVFVPEVTRRMHATIPFSSLVELSPAGHLDVSSNIRLSARQSCVSMTCAVLERPAFQSLPLRGPQTHPSRLALLGVECVA
jgi:pimeloyl-ACP methyl ester carboxylesterase